MIDVIGFEEHLETDGVCIWRKSFVILTKKGNEKVFPRKIIDLSNGKPTLSFRKNSKIYCFNVKRALGIFEARTKKNKMKKKFASENMQKISEYFQVDIKLFEDFESWELEFYAKELKIPKKKLLLEIYDFFK